MQRWGLGKLLRRFLRSLRQLLGEGWLWGQSNRSHPPPPQVEQTTTGDRNQSIAEMQGGNAIANARDVYIGSRPTAAGKPFQAPPLPQHYVDRPAVREKVRSLLLEETATASGTLVVSAISGLGGIGKSVLAMALAHEKVVQERFGDGVLWVTLGQQPDVLGLVSSWIQALKDYDYKPTTVEAASSHVQSLLYDKRALLVVDDAWSEEDAVHFLVGGAGCRVLVTTREVVISGAAQHILNVMSEGEALALMQNCLGKKWRSHDQGDAVALARSLGYLPLALELAAVLVGEGDTWLELRREFEQESAKLERLDRLEAENYSTDQQRRKYSLQACFNLSLRRLSRVALGQFAWLGVLPEDVSIEARMAATLWQVSEDEAGRILRYLKGRALLTVGVTTLKGRSTYRLHDLMHDAAQGLLVRSSEATELPGLGFERVAEAHRQLVERYRSQVSHQRWDRLPNDGYIHRHLTWHLEKAGRSDEIHALMAMSDEQGRNAWFEACDRLWQPAIFVQDVGRGWKCAEEHYEVDQARSIVLQCRYALITATLNSLVANLPIGMMTTFVQRGYWTPEQAWAYVEQMQDEKKIAEAIEKLAPHLPDSIFRLAMVKARSIQSKDSLAKALSALAQIDSTYFGEALEAAQEIQDEDDRAQVLIALAQTDNADFAQLSEVAREIEDVSWRAETLSALAQIDSTYFAEALEAAQEIEDEFWRAETLSTLAQIDNTYFGEALEAARKIQNTRGRAGALSALAQIDSTYFTEALEAARKIEDVSGRARALSDLAQIDKAYCAEALEAARKIQDKSKRAGALSALAQTDNAYFGEALEAAREIQNVSGRIMALSALEQIDNACWAEALEAVRKIQDESKWARALNALAQIDNAYFGEALEAARKIQDANGRARALSDLAQIDNAYFEEALEAAVAIQDESKRAEVLSALVRIDDADFAQLLGAALAIQNESKRAKVLSALVRIDDADFAQLLEAALAIQGEDDRAGALSALAQVDNADFAQLLEAALAIQNESKRAKVLSALVQIDNTDFAELIEAVRTIQKIYRARVLSDLAQIDNAYFGEALEAARKIQDEYWRAEVLRTLAQIDNAYFGEALEAACLVQEEDDRTQILSDLAQIDSANFAEALKAVRAIQDESSRIPVLNALAEELPEALVPIAFAAIHTIIHKPSRASAYRAYLPRLSLVTLSHPDWQSTLHLLAHCDRAALMQDLATLYPAILHLGGTAAIRGMVDAMRDVCQQWK